MGYYTFPGGDTVPLPSGADIPTLNEDLLNKKASSPPRLLVCTGISKLALPFITAKWRWLSWTLVGGNNCFCPTSCPYLTFF